MKKSILVVLLVLVGALAGGGSYGYLYYNSLTNLDFQVENFAVTEINLSLLSDSSATVQITGNVSSPQMTIKIDQVNFRLAVEGVDIGPGVLNSFTATTTPSEFSSTIVIENLAGAGLTLLTTLQPGENITVNITLLDATVYGISVNLGEKVISQEIEY